VHRDGPRYTLAVEHGHIVLDGTQQAERFGTPCGGEAGSDPPAETTIPPDLCFMMGERSWSL